MKRFFALIASVAVCLSLAACGADKANGNLESNMSVNQESVTGTSLASNAADSTSTKSTASTTKTTSTKLVASKNTTTPTGTMSLKEYIDSLQDTIDQMSANATGMKLKVYAKGNTLVYSYQYTIDIGDVAVAKKTLEDAMKSMDSYFTSMISLMQEAVPDAKSILIEYLDMNGKVITSKEYKA